MTGPTATVLPGGHSEWEPPDPFSNSEVKTLCADASVDFVDVKVGHCQALNLMNTNPHRRKPVGVFPFGAQDGSGRIRGPTRSLDAELLGVFAVQSLPASELHGRRADDT